MLSQILHELKNAKGPVDLNELSRRLGVQRSALDGMIQFLVRKGRLREVGIGETPPACASCPIHSTCEPMLGVHLWELTEKGRRWLREPPGSLQKGSPLQERESR